MENRFGESRWEQACQQIRLIWYGLSSDTQVKHPVQHCTALLEGNKAGERARGKVL